MPLRPIEVMPVMLEEQGQVVVGVGMLRVDLDRPAVVLLGAVVVMLVVVVGSSLALRPPPAPQVVCLDEESAFVRGDVDPAQLAGAAPQGGG